MYDDIIYYSSNHLIISYPHLISGLNFYTKRHIHCIKVALKFMTDLMIPVDWCMYVNVAYVYMCERDKKSI